jgi:hypothetical protein
VEIGEISPEGFVMEQDLEQTTALLSRTPAALNALLRDLPESWTHRNEGDGTWNVFEVIGHLIDCEHTNWIPRAEWIMQYGETQPFRPFDRGGHIHQTQGKSLGQLLDEFVRLRVENLGVLSVLNFQAEDLAKKGRHPSFGAVTLSELLATWAAHDLTHLHQISRIMAHQYREAVGPWSKFLGVLQCAGHSAKA